MERSFRAFLALLLTVLAASFFGCDNKSVTATAETSQAPSAQSQAEAYEMPKAFVEAKKAALPILEISELAKLGKVNAHAAPPVYRPLVLIQTDWRSSSRIFVRQTTAVEDFITPMPGAWIYTDLQNMIVLRIRPVSEACDPRLFDEIALEFPTGVDSVGNIRWSRLMTMQGTEQNGKFKGGSGTAEGNIGLPVDYSALFPRHSF